MRTSDIVLTIATVLLFFGISSLFFYMENCKLVEEHHGISEKYEHVITIKEIYVSEAYFVVVCQKEDGKEFVISKLIKEENIPHVGEKWRVRLTSRNKPYLSEKI